MMKEKAPAFSRGAFRGGLHKIPVVYALLAIIAGQLLVAAPVSAHSGRFAGDTVVISYSISGATLNPPAHDPSGTNRGYGGQLGTGTMEVSGNVSMTGSWEEQSIIVVVRVEDEHDRQEFKIRQGDSQNQAFSVSVRIPEDAASGFFSITWRGDPHLLDTGFLQVYGNIQDRPSAPPETVAVTGIRFDRERLELAPKVIEDNGFLEVHVTAIIDPQQAGNKAVIWSANHDLVKVEPLRPDSAGNPRARITAYAPAETVQAAVTVTTVEGGHTAVLPVRVLFVPVRNLKITPPPGKQIFLMSGESVRIQYAFDPPDATNKRIIWHSSNPRIADISAEGLITAQTLFVYPGEAAIILRLENTDFYITYKVVVTRSVSIGEVDPGADYEYIVIHPEPGVWERWEYELWLFDKIGDYLPGKKSLFNAARELFWKEGRLDDRILNATKECFLGIFSWKGALFDDAMRYIFGEDWVLRLGL